MPAMKKKLLVLLLCAAFSFTARSQPYYTFTKASEPYADLDNPQVVNNKDSIATDYKWNVPGTYHLFGEQLSTVFTIGRGGFIFCGNNEYFMPVSPFMAFLEKRDSSSSIAVIKENNILKIQWKNMGLRGHSDSDFVNFQLWLYTALPRIEFRYGKGRVTDTAAFSGKAGATVVLSMFNAALDEVYEYHHVVGDPEVPSDDTVGTEQSLAGLPAEGTVYRFENVPTGWATAESSDPIRLYPNPAKDFVNIDGVAPGAQYTIADFSGRIVSSGGINEGGNALDIRMLPGGIYVIKIFGKGSVRAGMMIKE